MFRPIGNHLLVRVIPLPDTTPGGIAVAKIRIKEQSTRAEVVAVGAGSVDDKGRVKPVDVQPGQVVQFRKFALHELPGQPRVNNERLAILHINDVRVVEI